VIPPAYVHSTARVEASVIGPHATIAANCTISHSIIRDSIIDAGSEVRNMILDQSLIGQKSRVIGHTQTLNIGDEIAIDSSPS